MVSHCGQIMEKTRTFQMVYAGPTNLCQQSTTDLARGIMMNELKNLHCRRHDLSNILKQQAAFLYSIYHRAGKTSLFHMKGSIFHAF